MSCVYCDVSVPAVIEVDMSTYRVMKVLQVVVFLLDPRNESAMSVSLLLHPPFKPDLVSAEGGWEGR